MVQAKVGEINENSECCFMLPLLIRRRVAMDLNQ